MNVLKDIANRLFSVYCWIATFAWMITWSTLGAPIFWLLGQQRAHKLILWTGLGGCIPLCFIEVNKHFHPDFDHDMRGIFLMNHVSVLDGSMATWTIPHPFCGLFNHWHFHVPGYGWIMHLSKGIGVPKGKEGRTEKLGAAVKNRVFDHNISVLTFPEGHRTLDGNVREFRRGVFFMAREAGVCVIPMVQRGMFALQNKNSPRFRPGTVDIYFGKPIPTAGLTDEQIGELAAHCGTIHETWLNGEMPQLEGFEEPPKAAQPVAA